MTSVVLTNASDPGNGKSFMSNIVCGADKFVHSNNALPVTKDASVATAKLCIGAKQLDVAVIDCPGLNEVNGLNFNHNACSFQWSMKQGAKQVVAYCLGNSNGRVKLSDITVFKTYCDAYDFDPDSVCFIASRISESVEFTNEVKKAMLPFQVKHLVYIDDMTAEMKATPGGVDFFATNPKCIANRNRLLAAIAKLVPKAHKTIAEIRNAQAEAEKLRKEATALAEQQRKLAAQQEAERAAQAAREHQARAALANAPRPPDRRNFFKRAFGW